MTVATLTTLYEHHRWANLRLLDCCAGLTDAQLDAVIGGTYGSIRETLQHIVAGERSYVSRLTTGQPYRRPADAAPPSMAELRDAAAASGAALIALAPTITAEDAVEVDWDGMPRRVPKTILLTQAINHATEHRAQIMATLTQIGVNPPELSGWAYFDALES